MAKLDRKEYRKIATGRHKMALYLSGDDVLAILGKLASGYWLFQ